MSRVVKPKNSQSNGSASLGFEAKLWLAADKLRNNMDAGEYKHVVLGLFFSNIFPIRSRKCASNSPPAMGLSSTSKFYRLKK